MSPGLPPGPPVVLITGATGGIGAATARTYVRQGARVVLLARSAGLLARLAEELGTDRTLVTVADVGSAEDVAAAFAAAVRRFGRVDVVAHTAAVVAYGRHEEVPAEVWDQVIRINVTGTANVARSALAEFARRPGGGSLVVVGSLLGQVTVPYMGAYVTSKWAVRGLVRLLQQEARELPGVRIGTVNPGSIATPVYTLAANYAGRIGRPPPPAWPAEAVADEIVRVAAGGRRVAGVNPTNPVVRLGFTLVPRLYDVLVPRLARVATLRRQRVDPHPGNVFVPSERVRVPADGPPPWPGRTSPMTALVTGRGSTGEHERAASEIAEETAGQGPRA